MEQTRSLVHVCQVLSCLIAFIYASLRSLHLKGQEQVCKWNGRLLSRQSPLLLQLPCLILCSVQVSFFHLLSLWVLSEQPVTLQFTFGITKQKLYDKYLMFILHFSQVLRTKTQHDSVPHPVRQVSFWKK